MQARTKLIKNLEQQIEATTDPQLKADLSRQLTKLVTTAKRRGRPRKSEATAPSKKTNWDIFREQYTGSVFDAMSDVELMVHHMSVLSEKKRKETGASTKEAVADVVKSLPEKERAAYEALNVKEAQITQHQVLLDEAIVRVRARMGKDNAESLKGC